MPNYKLRNLSTGHLDKIYCIIKRESEPENMLAMSMSNLELTAR
jgi:hypothetical protein